MFWGPSFLKSNDHVPDTAVTCGGMKFVKFLFKDFAVFFRSEIFFPNKKSPKLTQGTGVSFPKSQMHIPQLMSVECYNSSGHTR